MTWLTPMKWTLTSTIRRKWTTTKAIHAFELCMRYAGIRKKYKALSELEIKKLKVSWQYEQCKRNDIWSLGLLDTKEEFIPLIVSSIFWHFVYSCNRRSVALHGLFNFFTIANALFTPRKYAGAVSRTFTTNCNVCTKQPECFQLTNASWWSFSHNITVIFQKAQSHTSTVFGQFS